MIRILVAEDHEIVRQGLILLLQRETRFQIVGEVRDGMEAVESVGRLKPDVLLLDLTLPKLHGLDVLTALKTHRGTHTVVLTMHSDRVSVLESFRLGAKAFIQKDTPFIDLVSVIQRVARGDCCISPRFEPMLRQSLMESLSAKPRDAKDPLTRREQMVMQAVAAGKGNDELAKELGISMRTVEKHRGNAMRRLGLHSEAELVRYAVRHGLVKL